MFEEMGKLLTFIGISLTVIGLIIIVFSKLGASIHIGKLPGDILIKKDGFTFYFPITTSILVSIILSFLLFIIVNVVKR